MKKGKKYFILILAGVIFTGLYYYITLPAINIHSSGFWTTLMAIILFITFAGVFGQLRRQGRLNVVQNKTTIQLLKEIRFFKVGIALFLLVLLIYVAGNILSSPIVNAGKYQKLLNVVESDLDRKSVV